MKRLNDNGGLVIDESPALKLNRQNENQQSGKLAPFIHKLEHLLRNNRNVFWSEDGKFLVIDGIRSAEFSQELSDVQLSNKHESFIRQMNTYGFRKEEYTPSSELTRPIRYPSQLFAYYNPNFTQNVKNLTAVHNKGKRKPIQQERETVNQLKGDVLERDTALNQLAIKLAKEQEKTKRQQEFMTQIATSIGMPAFQSNLIYKFLATEGKETESQVSPFDSLINSTSISRSLTPNSQIVQKMEPLNVTIPMHPAVPIQVQPTNETQTIQVGGSHVDEFLKNPVYAAVYIKTLLQAQSNQWTTFCFISY